ncbi:hypothetical protein GCM10010430_76420 [Kitasatospora cystarginea]|uniref:Uncharacterized protein n=1 Tax=Kitasatospora cystarginea TaxID=58350 RepID=A0ABN3EZQ4_9ACTN
MATFPCPGWGSVTVGAVPVAVSANEPDAGIAVLAMDMGMLSARLTCGATTAPCPTTDPSTLVAPRTAAYCVKLASTVTVPRMVNGGLGWPATSEVGMSASIVMSAASPTSPDEHV